MKRSGIALPGFKLDTNGKVVADHGARLAKLPVNKRIAAQNSKRVRVVAKRGRP